MTRPIDAFTEQPPACPWKQLIAKVRYEAGQVYGRNADRYWQTERILAVIEAHALAAANMESQLAEAKAEIERLALNLKAVEHFRAELDEMDLEIKKLEQQLTAAQQAKEAIERELETLDRASSYWWWAYQKAMGKPTTTTHPSTRQHIQEFEAAEARVKRLENEIRLAEEHYGESAAGFAKTTLDRLAALEAENTRLREQLAGSVGGGAGWQDSASEI